MSTIANCGGLRIDGSTLYEEDGVLKAQSSGGGGLFLVDFTVDESGTVTATKTPSEVEAAMWTQPVLGRYTIEEYSFPLSLLKGQGGDFPLAFVISGANVEQAEWYILQDRSNNTWTFYQPS